MIQALTIMLREGVESFIVVAIIVTYLMRTSRTHLVPAAYAGVGAALLATVYGTWLLFRFGENTLQEGITCLIAAGLTGTMVVWMWKTGRTMRRDIEARVDRASGPATRRPRWLSWPGVGVFAAAFLLIAREGAEAGFLFVSLVRNSLTSATLWGAVLGVILAVAMGMLWIQNSRRVNLRLFFQVTGIFLLIFVAQLVLTGVHELAEAGAIPHAREVHDATEPWVEQGAVARWITLLMVVVPGLWLAVMSILGGSASPARREPVAPGRGPDAFQSK